MATGASDKSRIPDRCREAWDRLSDKMRLAEKRGGPEYTVFFDPETLQVLEPFLSRGAAVPWRLDGGWEGAEYQVVLFNPEELEEHPVKVVTAKPAAKTCSWTHRDVLGAVLGAGIQRDRIGDIHVHPWGAQILCLKEAAAILEWQLDSIHRDPVTVTVGELETLSVSTSEAEETVVFVSGLRADAVVAAVWNLSRGDAQALVRSEKVKLNYRTLTSVSTEVKPGDLISARGFGRVVFKEIQGTTRKDRIRILLTKTKG